MKRCCILAFAVVLIVSCRKSERDRDINLGAVEDQLRSEAYFYDVFSVVHEAALATQGIRSFTTHLSCATLTPDTLASPKQLTIDFGTSNCVGTDGRTRRGKLLCTFTSNYSDSLSIITITPQNYYFNDHKTDGAIVLTNMGQNALLQPRWQLLITNGKITPPSNSWFIQWECNISITQTAGIATLAAADDFFLLSGTANARGRHGDTFTSSTQTPETYTWACGEVTSGKTDVAPQNINTRHIDYGTTGCDTKVTVTIQGFTYEIHSMY